MKTTQDSHFDAVVTIDIQKIIFLEERFLFGEPVRLLKISVGS